jgi:cytochrome d ubiquinol oxidase subunit I
VRAPEASNVPTKGAEIWHFRFSWTAHHRIDNRESGVVLAWLGRPCVGFRRKEVTAGALLLSRLQFVWVIAWHILLPAFTVGLASYIAVLEGLYFITGRDFYLRLSNFWTKIFAVSFGMGVVSGIVMPFQFGTNWSRFADTTANILSPLLAYEGLMAFFLEAAFLGVLLFGRKLVPRWAHFTAALMVAAGTLFSSFWILSTNSWMQTPGGYEVIDGRFFPKDWVQIVFSASFPYRILHTVVAFYITTAFVVQAVAAHHLRHDRFVEEGCTMMKMALGLLTVLVPLQILIGDQHGENTLEYQPTKLAAIEAHWETGSHVPLVLFALPDEGAETNRASIEVPDLGSIILRHDRNGVVRGLKDWPRDQRPPVAIPFFAFRIMVGIGFVMLALLLVAWWLRARGRLFTSEAFLRSCEWAAPLGFLAVLAGWTTTEVGRQPWTVYGLLRTADSVSPSLTTGDVALSLTGYAIVYVIMYSFGIRQMYRMALNGPAGPAMEPELIESGRPARPVEALPERIETGS